MEPEMKTQELQGDQSKETVYSRTVSLLSSDVVFLSPTPSCDTTCVTFSCSAVTSSCTCFLSHSRSTSTSYAASFFRDFRDSMCTTFTSLSCVRVNVLLGSTCKADQEHGWESLERSLNPQVGISRVHSQNLLWGWRQIDVMKLTYLKHLERVGQLAHLVVHGEHECRLPVHQILSLANRLVLQTQNE